jgi:hypothetical protein
MTQQPGDGVGLVLALGDGGIAWPLGAPLGLRKVRLCAAQARRGIAFTALDLLSRQLMIVDGVKSLNPGRDLSVCNTLHFEMM